VTRQGRRIALQRTAAESLWAHTFPASAARLAAEYPRPCDACGARVAGLIREVVEGIACERCPTCREEGAIP
jgi:hypothetical protein